jgi:Zn-dependent protease with chaperone function
MGRKIIKGLNGYEFQHRYDRGALTALRNTNGVSFLFKKLSEYGLETFTRIELTGSGVRVTEKQMTSLYKILLDCCEILDIEVIPHLYIIPGEVNSYTIGVNQPIIVITNELVDSFTDEELYFIIGHQLSYIKTESLLYQQVATSFNSVMSAGAGVIKLFTSPIKAAIGAWEKMAHYTADRCGLLCCQNIDDASRALIKLAGMPARFYDDISIESFKEQSDEFDEFNLNNYNKFVKFLLSINQSMPSYIIRYAQLFKWYKSEDYDRILLRQAILHIENDIKCSYCGDNIAHDDIYCISCGNSTGTSVSITKTCSECKALNDEDSSFCQSCGQQLG